MILVSIIKLSFGLLALIFLGLLIFFLLYFLYNLLPWWVFWPMTVLLALGAIQEFTKKR